MKHPFAIALALLCTLGLTAGSANAQCSIEHPKKASIYRSRLVQVMVPCDAPNTTTEGGVPACQPPETYNDNGGNPANGWLWGPSSDGVVTIKATKNKIVNILNPPNSADLAIKLQLNQVFDANGAVASAPGNLAMVLRATIEDRDGGDMTVVDYAINFPFLVQGNKAVLKASANARLNELGLPGLPGCSTIEILGINVLDENGNPFAAPGTFLPDL